ncbi:hypothetical protein ABBQ38_014993 [Trebouxia sp. C0009 RCD-2024]
MLKVLPVQVGINLGQGQPGREQQRQGPDSSLLDPVLQKQWDHAANAWHAQWNHEANNDTPYDVVAPSNPSFTWPCHECGCEWSASANHSIHKSLGFRALYPDTAAEWGYGRNHSQPSDQSGHSSYLAWWSSPQRSSWQQTIHSRISQVQQRIAVLKRILQLYLALLRSACTSLAQV